jgi:hypothetical protein
MDDFSTSPSSSITVANFVWAEQVSFFDALLGLMRTWDHIKGIVSRDFGTLFLFHWIDLKVAIGPEQVYFSS